MVEASSPDLSALQVDLLQLPPEVPAPGAPALRGVLDGLFAHWLSLPDTAALVGGLAQNARASGAGPAAATLPSMLLQGGASVPPRSPRLSRRPSGVVGAQPNRSASPLRPATARPAKEVIPQVHDPLIVSRFVPRSPRPHAKSNWCAPLRVGQSVCCCLFGSFISKMAGHPRLR
jgi:serine/threonine-protein phosphatase 2A regulatory subunit B''